MDTRVDTGPAGASTGRSGWLLAGVGTLGAFGALAVRGADVRSAASQDWSPFVLVAGLLLVGLVADGDGLFAATGRTLGRLAPNAVVRYAGAAVLVVLVTTVLNLDTSVAFLTPVLVHSAGDHRGAAPLLYGCLLLSNAGSLLLPGSNLTNLIVLGHLHLSGGAFLRHTAPAAVGAAVVTAVVVGVVERRSFRGAPRTPPAPDRPVVGLGLLAVVTVTGCVVLLSSPALPVAAVGVVAVGLRYRRPGPAVRNARTVLALPTLLGLFGVAVTLGTVGRAWSGPATLLGHLDGWETAVAGAVASVVVNNLPAASLLAARVPPRPFALLVGLNLGPNLFVTGSLAWLLWLRAARAAGARPSIARAGLLGAVAVPLSVAAALGGLALTGSR